MKKINAIVRLYVNGVLINENTTSIVCKDVEGWRKRVENNYRRGYQKTMRGSTVLLTIEEI